MANDQKTSTPSSKGGKTINPPLLLETIFTLSWVWIIAVGVATAGLSIYSGSNIPTILLRSGIAILSMGFLLWTMSWLLARNTMEQVTAQLKRTLSDPQPSDREGWNA